jgi:CheY-like chemotaxis protein
VLHASGILIVDDDAAFRLLLRSLLEAAGLAVVGEAANGVEAVELAERLQPARSRWIWTCQSKGGAAATLDLLGRLTLGRDRERLTVE